LTSSHNRMLLSTALAALTAIIPAHPGSTTGVTTVAPECTPASGTPAIGTPAIGPIQARRIRGRGDDTSHHVRLLSERDKVQLAASYFAPRKTSSRAPGVIMIHDAGQDRGQLEDLANYLNRKGFGVLTLDLRGDGESTTQDRDWNTMDEKARGATWAFAGRDLSAAAAFLREKKEIHSANLSIVAVGASCSLAVRYAVDDENARAVVLINPLAETQGAKLETGLIELEGLPTLIVAPKEGRDLATELKTGAEKANDDYEFVDVQVMRSSSEELLGDKRLNNSSATWLKNQVAPSKKK